MKARALKADLNTDYIVHFEPPNLCVGVPHCPGLITLNTRTGKMELAIAIHSEGPNDKRHPELLSVWKSLETMYATGKIEWYLNGDDELPDPVPVFFKRGYCICSSYIDRSDIDERTNLPKWPVTAHDGSLVFLHTHYLDKSQFLAKLKKNTLNSQEMLESSRERILNDLKDNDIEISKVKRLLEELSEAAG